MNKFQEKEKRRARRQYQRNEIARDLHSPKYRQRVIHLKRSEDIDELEDLID